MTKQTINGFIQLGNLKLWNAMVAVKNVYILLFCGGVNLLKLKDYSKVTYLLFVAIDLSKNIHF